MTTPMQASEGFAAVGSATRDTRNVKAMQGPCGGPLLHVVQREHVNGAIVTIWLGGDSFSPGVAIFGNYHQQKFSQTAPQATLDRTFWLPSHLYHVTPGSRCRWKKGICPVPTVRHVECLVNFTMKRCIHGCLQNSS